MENFITVPKEAEITDEFALEADKKKAYQIFALSALFSAALTVVMYFAANIQF
ncbi:MAG: hypothetical protein ACXAE3_08215 [Candidatus Kariarchaeaceae archaeon]